MSTRAILSVALIALLTSPAMAFPEDPPEITPIFMVRAVNTVANAEGPPDSTHAADDAITTTQGPFTRTVRASTSGDKGSTATCTGWHKSNIAAFKIEGKAKLTSECSTFNSEGSSSAASLSTVVMQFTVPVQATFSIGGMLKAGGTGNVPPAFGGTASVTITLKGAEPDGTPINISKTIDETSTEPDEFFIVKQTMANIPLILTVEATCTSATDGTGFYNSTAEYSFQIDFGDRDGDGLLDAWETEGIDIDDDGIPEIDLPALGADPDHKDLFVELDAMSGVAVDLQAIGMVEGAFNDAPGGMIDNPDGQDGINLHVFIDETGVTSTPLVGASWPGQFDTIKQNNSPSTAGGLGSTAMRAHPDWQLVLKPAYARVYRYCLWADTLSLNSGLRTGVGERPGNDFIIAAGSIQNSSTWSNVLTQALAGTFMHELGHTLGFRHGGQDGKNYKPNYLSVMNYAYQIPFDQLTVEGTNVADVWFIDYARTLPKELNENELDETAGFDGPSNRKMIFNTNKDGFDPELEIADADAAEIDWNLSGPPIESEPVTVDLTRFTGTTDALDDVLTPYTDWDQIWYALSGDSFFADGTPRNESQIETPVDLATLEAIASATYHDRSTPNCPADMNADGILDLGDISTFVTLFLAQDLAADTNGDGFLDIGDVSTFVALFLAGC